MDNLQQIKTEADKAIQAANDLQELEQQRLAFLGKQGKISLEMRKMATLGAEEKKEFGATINQLKQEVVVQLEQKKEKLEQEALNSRLAEEKLDVTLPVRKQAQGSIHPVTQTIEEIITIFGDMGFSVAEGPEIEDDFHNFTALNIPEEHPARQMHDTFYFPEDEQGNRAVLRTHTSSVQIRWMEQHEPPYKIIAPGRTYRCDSDITHSPMFHQVEGLYIDKDIHMGHLKGCLKQCVEQFFGLDEVPVRFRPSYFPFTEPSAEMDIGCSREGGEFKIGAGQDWMEILGCGMVHPNVLKAVGIDPQKWQGFAFGMGVERMAMLKYGIPDLRTFFDSDTRWLKHYGFAPQDIPWMINI